VKNIFMELRYILNELKDKNEIAIVYKYSCTAKRYTVTLIGKIILYIYNINFVIIFLVGKYSEVMLSQISCFFQ